MGKMNLSVPNASARYRRAPEPLPRSAPRQDARPGANPPSSGSSKRASPSSRQVVDDPSRMRPRSLPPNRHIGPEETLPRKKVVGTPGRVAEVAKDSQKRKDGPEQEQSPPSKKSKSVDFSWNFTHSSGARPFPDDSRSCAELFRKIHFGEGRLPAVEKMKEADAVTDVAQASFEFIARINRLASRYERRVRKLEGERSGASSERIVRLEGQLGEAVRSNQRLSDLVAKLEHHRSGLITERDSLTTKLEEAEVACNGLKLTLNSETRRLRDRRDEYGHHERINAFHEVAGRVQRLLSKHKSYAEAVEASREKFLEYNQAVGNVQMLETLVAEGRISLLDEGIKVRVTAVMGQLKSEVEEVDLPDITEADFDMSQIFAGPLPPIPTWIASPISENTEVCNDEGGSDGSESGEIGGEDLDEQEKVDDRPSDGAEVQADDHPSDGAEEQAAKGLPRPLTPGHESPVVGLVS
ncbi:PREDICTED: uncharacterized protein LOC104789637 [Camelina sativa]|uniref:Uncharacterized protein LOC104789637 n=1 Tax=Camelina sativa TaxID=90675 RepID=A0ABM0ZC47_CAMSA|nr:PREDICTED: uncharacterized protein LOC104789637 [Camelina sativa]